MSYLTDDGKVKCAVCGKAFGNISPSHLKLHDMTVEDYKMKFPGAEFIGEKAAARRRLTVSKAEIFPETKQLKTKAEKEDDKVNQTDDEKIKYPAKRRIFKFLRDYFPNIKDNYEIQKKTLLGQIEFCIMSDLADPVRKIDFEFPDAFWHNPGFYYHNAVRIDRLTEAGWKVIKISGVDPDKDDLLKAIKGLY